jgi:hypothetical protein
MTIQANDNDLGWQILTKDGGVYLHWPARGESVNLGPKEAVFAKWADEMGQQDFGE